MTSGAARTGFVLATVCPSVRILNLPVWHNKMKTIFTLTAKAMTGFAIGLVLTPFIPFLAAASFAGVWEE